jgi:tRNA-uridine 2-sulfurtransferase
MSTGERLREHIEHPLGRGHSPANAFTGAAGGAACGDLVRISLALDPDSSEGTIADAGFDASGCGAAQAAGSATIGLILGTPLLDAAKIGADRIAAELGGLIPSKTHAAELAADALHRALGAAARAASLANRPSRSLVAMSGGVDSAVAALLTARNGAETVGCTLELWADAENDGEASCCSAQAVRSARRLAHSLGMPHLSIDLRAEFRAGVVDGWLSDHAAGLTPNPCIRCNGNVRLDAMLELASGLGAETLATGHYARVEEVGGAPLLMTALDLGKDQSYVLSGLAPESLQRLRFPLGELRKTEVREIAREAGLPVASKRDSQDLCFLAGTGREAFLARHGGQTRRPGPIVSSDGERLGEHSGAHLYTVGQRRGLGLSSASPLYVLATDAPTNTVTVGPREQLLSGEIQVREIVLHRPAAEVDGVRVRAHGRRHGCRLPGSLAAGRHARGAIELLASAERTAPGQLACLYSGERVVGHGTIAS